MECLTKLRPALLGHQPLAATVALSRGGLRSDQIRSDQIMIIWDKAEVIKVSDNALEHLEVPRGGKGCRYCTKVLLVRRSAAASFGGGGLPGDLVGGGGLGGGWGWF